MKTFYEASNAIEAHLLADLLRQEGLQVHVLGEYLQGGIGELPAAGFVRLAVDETDLPQARELVRQWEAGLLQTLEDASEQGGGQGSDQAAGVQTGNLFDDAMPPAQGERFEPLLSHRNLVIERIVSSASLTPTECVQPQDEWVVLLKGRARILVDEREAVLREGDHLFLPAGCAHTVQEVSQGAVWLAVHLHPEGVGPGLT
jgi:cupin 2 domain-containing protein